MSTHSGAYAHLKDAATDSVAARDLEVIRNVEKELDKTPYTYIPAPDISYEGMHPGDIICFVSGVKGLDISHVAVYAGDGRFIHASMARGKVVRDERTVREYVTARNIPGIKVVRPL